MKKGKIQTLIVLQGLENHLLNSLASESRKDIIKDVKEELKGVQEALKWVRSVGK